MNVENLCCYLLGILACLAAVAFIDFTLSIREYLKENSHKKIKKEKEKEKENE